MDDVCEFTDCNDEVTHELNDGDVMGPVYLCAHHAGVAVRRGYEPVPVAEKVAA